MTNILLVPIHLDALHLKYGTSVAEAMVEFNRLPYVNGERDVNPDTVNLSESIVSQPFQNKNLYLKAGIHLHWALPDALTKETRSGEFPTVPNRWLITRRNGSKTKHWVVESDYLSTDFKEDSVTYPYKTDTNSLPFRYLGRKLTEEEWLLEQKSQTKSEYLEKLTAVGYGEPTFAAFYPHCRSVFGFHDSEFEDFTSIPANLQYDVIGWYSDSKQDYLSEFFEDFKTTFQKDFPKDALKPEDFIDAIEQELKWKFQVPYEKDKNDPQKDRQNFINAVKPQLEWTGDNFNQDSKTLQIICYSRLTFSSPITQNPIDDKVHIQLAVANTGTEALSAYLAETLDKSQNKSQKVIIEEQLEALQFAESLETQQLDTGAKFQEIRHEAGFNGVLGGFLWKINLETKDSKSENQATPTKLSLPSEIASLLDQVNQKQQEYDCELAKINSRRRQLFSDWYKYMVSTYPPEDSWDNYPDIDAVKYYIEEKGLKPLEDKLNEIGKLKLFQNEAKKLNRASGSGSFFTHELAGMINDLIGLIDSLNKQLQDKYNKLDKEEKEKTPYPPTYWIERVSSPRYWQPKEPVVLMVGEAVKASKRHGQDGRLNKDGLLECRIIKLDKTIPDLKTIEDFKPIFTEINNIASQQTEKIGFSIWNKQPWNPFLLEWLVELFPVANGSNKTSDNRNYSDDFLVQNYTLEANDVDLSPKSKQSLVEDVRDNRIKTDSAPNIYSGFSILTPYANSLLQERIKEYLEKYGKDENYQVHQKLREYAKHLQNPKSIRDEEIEGYLRKNISKKYPQYEDIKNIEANPYLGKLENIEKLKKWYEEQKLITIPHPIDTATKAQAELKSLNCLSQALGGFNEALLMHKQTLQLGIQDPIGFEDYQTFTNAVAEAVEDEIKSAPQPLDDFSPIRSGEMRIIDLQLIDTFGQVRNLDWKEYVIKPESMKATEDYRIALPPRFVQPCRINFRWLSANEQDNCESNDHPDTTPICGWILPNNLNKSLMIYDNQGQALGSINLNGEWDNAPGANQIDQEETPNISNIHLQKLVKNLIKLGKNDSEKDSSGKIFLDEFNTCLNNALNNIDPENFAQHQSLALLMGRPIALVRASVNLELLGFPAINQDWNIFQKEMQHNISLEERDTDNFINVRFPIRIGEYQQLNDGVIGYWKEQKISKTEEKYNYEYENNIFYAQQSDSNESLYIETQDWDKSNNAEGVEEGAINIVQSISSPPQILTMLVDPRCTFHATSGILPSKAITIPSKHYTEALANIKVTFLTSPILTEISQIHLPLLNEPEYNWSWLEKRKDKWSEISTIPFIEKKTFIKYLENRHPKLNYESCWQVLLTQNWLEPTQKAKTADVVSKDKRLKLTGILEGFDDIIEEIFDLCKITSDSVTTPFIEIIEKEAFIKHLENRYPWQVLLTQKWLQQTQKAETADVVSKDKRLKLTGILEGLDELIEEIFDLCKVAIDPVTTKAKFSSQQEIREGWLVLKKDSS
ncbi:hypothetical protein [Microcoleus sp. Pol12B5]|uniref:hypothetical protein n=1 Tax=Microcoleus sp. Pol12B5 TaxID=3055396 RepID=UPI002FD49001